MNFESIIKNAASLTALSAVESMLANKNVLRDYEAFLTEKKKQFVKVQTVESKESEIDLGKLGAKIVSLTGLKASITGTWLWISGETKVHKELLKSLGLRYSSSKEQWYFTQKMPKGKFKGARKPFDEIVAKYGIENINQ
jgi:hypothetical protein